MAANSQDPMIEGVKRILQLGGTAGASLFELPTGTGATDLETLFLAELRSRRERLARWMQLIQEEVRREAAQPRSRTPRRRQCRNRVSRSPLSR
jgi:hypothetical protein